MDRIEKFISNCKPPKEKVYRPITQEEIETKKEILQYFIKKIR